MHITMLLKKIAIMMCITGYLLKQLEETKVHVNNKHATNGNKLK